MYTRMRYVLQLIDPQIRISASYSSLPCWSPSRTLEQLCAVFKTQKHGLSLCSGGAPTVKTFGPKSMWAGSMSEVPTTSIRKILAYIDQHMR